ncbi:MAG TPA: cytochrome c [Thermoanaerobaculia bacterium]|nr:cytochrome c [Thermoanaerobaculia bacterium]
MRPTTPVLLVCLSAVLAAPALAAPAGDAVTWSEDVAPIVFANCVQCHRPGEVAPMSLLDYSSARPWAKSIRRMVEARLMPPWGADPHVGKWANDMSLTDEEIATLVAWVEQGAPEGDRAALVEAPTFPEGWRLGPPDYVIELDPVTVPGDSEDLFPEQWVELSDLTETRWVRAIELLPGDRRVTHHFLATYNQGEKGATGRGQFETGAGRGGSGIFTVWTAGMQPYEFPEGMGRLVGPGTRILVNSHYHPVGEDTVDRTRIGLYFGEGELRKEVATLAIVNTGLRIPPGDPAYSIMGFHVFDNDSHLLAFSPHMHVRGKAMRYELVRPDGKRETLLDVPRYNYNYQWLYYPAEAIAVPAGSKLEVTATWDNSEGNPANPDPGAEIVYRGDTLNEMFVGFFEAIEDEGVYANPRPPIEKLTDLLRAHPTEESWLSAGMLPLGFYLPREGNGWIYAVNGATMTTITLDDIRWKESTVEIHTTFPTADADGLSTVIEARVDGQGQLVGTVHYGVLEEQAGEQKAMHLPFLAKPMSVVAPPATAGAGR